MGRRRVGSHRAIAAAGATLALLASGLVRPSVVAAAPRGVLPAAATAAVAGPNSVSAFGTAPTLAGPSPAGTAPVVGMATTPDGGGYWLVGSDGGVFTFGDARFFGSLGALRLNAPVVGVAATPDGGGYWLVGSDGGVFTFGDAPFRGSDGAAPSHSPAVAIAGRAGGYWVAYGLTALIPSLAAFVATRADNVTAAVYDINTGQTFTFRPGVVEHTASTVKVDILGTLLASAQAQGRGLTAQEQSLAVPMITESLDSAANALWVQLGPAAVAAFERSSGLSQTVPATDGVWGTTTTTALDRIAMIRSLVYPGGVLTDASKAYILNLMEHITPSQDWGITGGVPAGVTVALKNGFSIINGWQINSFGWVNGQGRNYFISVLTDGNPSEGYGIDTINGMSAIVWNALGHS
ncbi:MAG TPA: serine hydrolase [Acidimicrobiales bacterium]